jgi:hypothetical protein
VYDDQTIKYYSSCQFEVSVPFTSCFSTPYLIKISTPFPNRFVPFALKTPTSLYYPNLLLNLRASLLLEFFPRGLSYAGLLSKKILSPSGRFAQKKGWMSGEHSLNQRAGISSLKSPKKMYSQYVRKEVCLDLGYEPNQSTVVCGLQNFMWHHAMITINETGFGHMIIDGEVCNNRYWLELCNHALTYDREILREQNYYHMYRARE